MEIIGTLIILFMWLGTIYFKYQGGVTYTLIEVLIVMMIIAVILLITIPNFNMAVCKQKPFHSSCIERIGK